jgi:hypothetical protein
MRLHSHERSNGRDNSNIRNGEKPPEYLTTITDLDWELAGHLLDKSDEIRNATRGLIANKLRDQKTAAAKFQGELADTSATAAADAKVKRLGDTLIRHLKKYEDRQCPNGKLRASLSGPDRDDYEDVLEKLLADNVVESSEEKNSQNRTVQMIRLLS